MATRIQQIQLIQSAAFQQQVAGSLIAAAINVQNEAASTANHTARLAYANAIMLNPTAQAATIMTQMLSNATIAGEAGNTAGASGTPVADSDVDYVIASLFNQFASQFVV